MGGAMIALVVIGGFVVLVILWYIVTHNGLVRLRNEVKNAWAQIDVQLKRRHDLIPNLVETVKGYASHERETLDRVIQARSRAIGATNMTERTAAEGELGGALGRLMVLVEQYPDLKANTNFLSLQEELSSTENRIGFSRQAYNDAVMRYNTGIQVVPASIVAGMGGFTAEPFFQVEDAAVREAPKVKF